MLSRLYTAAICIILFPILNLSASYKDEVHYTQLINELSLRGVSVPTGAGVSVTQVESREDTNGSGQLDSYEGYIPNPSNSEFSGKTITDASNLGQDPSNHGTWVGRNLYGNTSSISPGITAVSVYEANNFINSGWYSGTPPTESNPLQNHSWVNWFQNSNTSRRMDYAVNRDGFLPIVGIYNSDFGSQSTPSDIPDTYASIYNGITVGVSDGTHRYGTTTYDGAGRTKPEIVAPGGIPGLNPATQYTSFATPIVTAAAAYLIDAAGSNAAAKDQLSLKAILLAGADKSISANWDQTPTRPIDDVFGAGELDIYQSYFIQQGGQQIAGSIIGTHGWNLSNLSAYSSETYVINISSGFRLRKLSVIVTWNRKVKKQGPYFNPTLANMSLELTDDGDNSSVQSSDSAIDNIEHIWRDLGSELEAGSYNLTVATNLTTDYAIAWRSELYQDYTLWSSNAFTSSTPSAEQDPTDDPDGDGIENQLEQAFGGDPETNDLSILPISETIEDGGQSYLQISYRKSDFENGLNYTVETVTDLNGTWSSSTSEVELISITSETGAYDRYTYRRVAPLSSHEKAFLRVSVTQ
ncbi:MAG: S8 family serine peptidase [Puniceicoccaceae bacterium]|nr:S8 family serine peptidase [Puniceicoccaceae bacterium]